MRKVRNENLSATMEVHWTGPFAFAPVALRAVADSALVLFSEYGLTPPQVFQRTGDQLFDFALSFSLFRSQGTFRLGCETMALSVQNARGRQDVEVIRECFSRALRFAKSSDSGQDNFPNDFPTRFLNPPKRAIPFFSLLSNHPMRSFPEGGSCSCKPRIGIRPSASQWNDPRLSKKRFFLLGGSRLPGCRSLTSLNIWRGEFPPAP